jgi:AGZA family xanthine/uracil permease-like MFS transporter
LEFSGHKHERKGSRFLKEIRAGLATFFAMAYIISVNASIVASSGGTCKCDRVDALDDCSGDLEYMKCVQEVNQDLVTATAAISGVSSVLLGVFSNMPIAMAPGMGVNAYFAYQVVGFHGTGGSLSYEMALTAVFAEGLIFAAMTIFGLRQWLARTIPSSLKIASGAGIGLYLALLGLTYDAGLGVVTGGMTTPLELAGCDPTLRNGTTGVCESGKMSNPTLWVGIACGGFVTSFLMMYRIKGALIMGILLVSIISWPRGTSVSLFPYTDIGEVHFAFFKKVVTVHPVDRVLIAMQWKIRGENAGQFILTIVTFLYVDILDSTGTLYSMARFCGAIDEDTQDFEGSFAAYFVDAICISIGALLGCPPVTPYIESGAGISEGGATGLTAVVTGVCFLLSIFFAPIFASIPPWATGSALILVGAMMARAAVDINWRYVGDSVPAFLTLAVMPLTYSIAHGLIAYVTHL